MLRRLRNELTSVRVPVPERRRARPLLRALRPHQWVKNLLLLVPIVTSHRMFDVDVVGQALVAMVAFCLGASAIYIANDVVDIHADLLHPRKRFRPFAAGDLSISAGLATAATLVVSALGLAYSASPALGGVLAIYVGSSLAYSLRIKRAPVADVFLLTGLYVLRIYAGGVATGIVISSWLLTFAMFFFLNLALAKRYTELRVMTRADTAVTAIAGRGYTAADGRWMQGVGISAGYMAVLVLALYANAPGVAALYTSPAVLMWLCPVLLYWVTRTWFNASRDSLADDPVVEALRDPMTYVLTATAALVLVAAY